jgi:hypothetical protein
MIRIRKSGGWSCPGVGFVFFLWRGAEEVFKEAADILSDPQPHHFIEQITLRAREGSGNDEWHVRVALGLGGLEVFAKETAGFLAELIIHM